MRLKSAIARTSKPNRHNLAHVALYSIHKPTGQQLAEFDQSPARRYSMMGGLSRGQSGARQKGVTELPRTRKMEETMNIDRRQPALPVLPLAPGRRPGIRDFGG
jgi:hypothetical protein